MGIYVFDNELNSFDRFCVIDEDELTGSEIITIEEHTNDKTLDYRYILLIEDVEFKDEKPIIYSKEKAKLIFGRFIFKICMFYVHPSAIDQEFIDWFVEKFPMDILKLPLEEIDFDIAYKALLSTLQTLEDDKKYSYWWFSNIFTDMPIKFKDEYMCKWAYLNNPDLVKTFPSEFINYDMFYDLSDNTYLRLNDVPSEYRDEKMCIKFLRMKRNIGGKV